MQLLGRIFSLEKTDLNGVETVELIRVWIFCSGLEEPLKVF